MSQEEIIIAAENEITDPGSKGLSVSIEGAKLELFIVKKDSKIAVYENSCPHTQGPLDWTPDQFLDMDNNYIMCANHGALFEINNGLCIYGPCKEQSLKELPYTIKDGNIYLML
jgi:nitrite reductase/ring-hydroxylating ferredoxin subunit